MLFDGLGLECGPCNRQAAIYIRIVSPGVIVFFWGQSINGFCSMQGKPFYSLVATAGASVIHWIVAYVLAVCFDMKMVGVAIASCVQFIFRFLIIFICAKLDKDLNKSFIPIFHEDSFKDLGYVV